MDLSKIPVLSTSIMASDSGVQPHDMDEERHNKSHRLKHSSPSGRGKAHGTFQPNEPSNGTRIHKHSQGGIGSGELCVKARLQDFLICFGFLIWGHLSAGQATHTSKEESNESTLHFSPDSPILDAEDFHCETSDSFLSSRSASGDSPAKGPFVARSSLADEAEVLGSSEIAGQGGRDGSTEAGVASLDTAIDILTTCDNAAEDGMSSQGGAQG